MKKSGLVKFLVFLAVCFAFCGCQESLSDVNEIQVSSVSGKEILLRGTVDLSEEARSLGISTGTSASRSVYPNISADSLSGYYFTVTAVNAGTGTSFSGTMAEENKTFSIKLSESGNFTVTVSAFSDSAKKEKVLEAVKSVTVSADETTFSERFSLTPLMTETGKGSVALRFSVPESVTIKVSIPGKDASDNTSSTSRTITIDDVSSGTKCISIYITDGSNNVLVSDQTLKVYDYLTSTFVNSDGNSYINDSGVFAVTQEQITAAHQKYVYVDGTNGNDGTGTGSPLSPYKTLSKAVAQASDDDTVFLKNSTTEDSSITVNKNITIRSYSGNYTIERGNCTGSMIIVNSGKTLKMKNVTIDGDKDKSVSVNGGGINCNGGTLELTNVTVQYCKVSSTVGIIPDGGGIYIKNSACTLNSCTVKNCSSTNGGGIACNNSSLTIDGSSSIQSNTASKDGGGIYCDNSGQAVTVGANAAVTGNSAGTDGKGGGIYFKMTPVTDIAGNITSNSSGYDIYYGVNDNTKPLILSGSGNAGNVYIYEASGRIKLNGSSVTANITFKDSLYNDTTAYFQGNLSSDTTGHISIAPYCGSWALYSASSTYDGTLASTLYVDSNASASGNGSSAAPYKTLKEAAYVASTTKIGNTAGNTTGHSYKIYVRGTTSETDTATFGDGSTYKPSVTICKSEGGTATVKRDTASGSMIIVKSGANVTLQNITLDGSGTEVNADGAGIYNSGTLTLDGAVVQNCKNKGVLSRGDSSGDVYGGGIYNAGTCTLQNGSSVKGCCSAKGGGIYNNNYLNVSYCDFNSNAATKCGCAVYNESNFYFTGGTISINNGSSDVKGKGIYQNGSLFMSGTAIVTGSDIYLPAGKKVYVDNTLNNSPAADLTPYSWSDPNAFITATGSGSFLNNNKTCKFSASASGYYFDNNGKIQSLSSASVTTLDNFTCALNQTEPVTLNLKSDLTIESTITIPAGTKTILADSSNVTLSRSTTNSNQLFIINDSSSTLTLGGGSKKLTVDGGSGMTATTSENTFDAINALSYYNENSVSADPMLKVSGGKLVIKDNAELTHCYFASGTGAALFIENGEVDMTGGTISYCITTGNYGAVKVEGGVFKMSGGTIQYCKTTGSMNKGGGGAIYQDGGEVYISGSALIQYNIGRIRGGAIGIHSGKLYMSGGSISNNWASWKNFDSGGGGIGLQYGELNITGGSITGNNAMSSWGGGIRVYGGKFTLSSLESVKNNTSSTGKNIYVNVSESTIFNLANSSVDVSTTAYSY